MKKVGNIWNNLTIKNKIRVFTGSVFLAILAALLFDVWIIRLFVIDFNEIMEDNSVSGELIAALNREIDTFDLYVHGSDPSGDAEWEKSVQDTKNALDKLDLDYKHLGDERYALLYSFNTA